MTFVPEPGAVAVVEAEVTRDRATRGSSAKGSVFRSTDLVAFVAVAAVVAVVAFATVVVVAFAVADVARDRATRGSSANGSVL